MRGNLGNEVERLDEIDKSKCEVNAIDIFFIILHTYDKFFSLVFVKKQNGKDYQKVE